MNKLMFFIGNSVVSLSKRISIPIHLFKYLIAAVTSVSYIKKKKFYNTFTKELYFAGISAIPIIVILGLSTGFLINLLFPFDQLSFGIENIYGYVFSTFILRQLTPLVTSLVVVIRSTIFITIHITRMKLSGEIETLEIMGINPIQYLGAVRIVAGIITVPLLGIYFLGFAFFSSLVSAFIFHNVPIRDFMAEILDTASLNNFFIYLFKCTTGGLIIYFTAINIGLSARKKRGMLVTKTIQAITITIFLIFLLNFIITVATYES